MPVSWDTTDELIQSQGVTTDSLGDHETDQFVHGWEYESTTQDLVAYYPFDGDVNDATPLGNNGTDNTSAGFVSGQVGSDAKEYDGTDDYVSIPNLIESVSVDFTVSMWVNFDAFAPDLYTEADSADDQPRIQCNTKDVGGGDHRFNLAIFGDGGNSKASNGSTSLSTGQWYHVAWVYDNSKPDIQIYADGSPESMTDGSTQSLTDASMDTAAIGAFDGASTTNFTNGTIDDVRVYDRVLSQKEVERLSNLTTTSNVYNGDVL